MRTKTAVILSNIGIERSKLPFPLSPLRGDLIWDGALRLVHTPGRGLNWDRCLLLSSYPGQQTRHVDLFVVPRHALHFDYHHEDAHDLRSRHRR